MTTLPDKPSDLIELALADLRKVEHDKRYVVYMHDWHVPNTDVNHKQVCSVCLAGAVMAGTLGYAPTERVIPYETGVGSQLAALEELRCGDIYTALGELEREYDGSVPEFVRMPPYDERDPEPFHGAMAALAQRLRALGH